MTSSNAGAQGAGSSGTDSRGHLPGDKWEFDETVTSCFEDMLRRSIPQYDVMRKAIFDLACHYCKPRTAIIDLGASRGDGLAPLVEKFGAYNTWIAVEISPPMLQVLRERFAGLVDGSFLRVMDMDLRTGFPPVVNASVILSVLTLQFTPIEYRQQIVKRAFDALAPGGALLLVEKIIGATAELDEVMVEMYYDFKRASGYTEDEIQRKRMALEGVLVPLTAEWDEALLRRCGFQHVDCFWRWMNFAGWVAVK